MNFYIGCPIWSFKGWEGNFYPEGAKPSEFLREYSKGCYALHEIYIRDGYIY